MRTKTGLYKHQELTYQNWQTNSRRKYQPPLPLGMCEFDSWCSLAPAVGMRKHGMGAEERQSEKCFAGLLLCRDDGHTRPDLVDPPGLAGDMAGGGPEAVLQQEIPVI